MTILLNTREEGWLEAAGDGGAMKPDCYAKSLDCCSISTGCNSMAADYPTYPLIYDKGFTEAHNLLTNHLDNLMKIFQCRDPNFYQGYLSAREVVNY